MPSIENVEEGAAPQVPKTELEELQIKANSVADEVRKPLSANPLIHLLLNETEAGLKANILLADAVLSL